MNELKNTERKVRSIPTYTAETRAGTLVTRNILETEEIITPRKNMRKILLIKYEVQILENLLCTWEWVLKNRKGWNGMSTLA